MSLNDAPIRWLSKKQIDSSAMAKIYALSESVRVARSIAWRCEEMGMKFQSPLCVQVDNRQAKTFQAGTCINSKIRGVCSHLALVPKVMYEGLRISPSTSHKSR